MSVVQLDPPIEFLELPENVIYTISPLEYEAGQVKIMPRLPNPQVEKTIDVLRIWYDKDPDTAGLDYIDISSKTLIAQIMPLLDAVIKDEGSIEIKAFGVAPKKRFTVKVI